MNERKYQLLQDIVEEYIKTAEPVSSKLIAQMVDFDVSPATIRNEMAELEDEGLLMHPHTSAGRIPTQLGYRFYVQHFLKPQEPSAQKRQTLAHAIGSSDALEHCFKKFAKELAEMIEYTVLVGFDSQTFYYTGVSFLFRQPEFKEGSDWIQFGDMIDHLDQVMHDLYDQVPNDPTFYIGSQNPFSDQLSLLACRNMFKESHQSDSVPFIGILGPLRMDYNKVMGAAKAMQEL